jgi:Flp pilus assembly protein TadB
MLNVNTQSATLAIGSLLWGLAAVSALVYIGPVWDMIARRKYATLIERGERLRLSATAMRLGLRAWGLLLTSVFVGLWWGLEMPPVACAVSWLVYVAPHYVLTYFVEGRATLLRDQMATAAIGVANAVRAGLGFADGLETVAKDSPAPLADEFKTVVREFKNGRPLKDALEAVRQRLQLDPFTLFVSAAQASLERGGRLNEALERISRSLEDYQRLERKMRAETANSRRVVTILAAFPFIFLFMFYTFDPHSTSFLFVPPRGQFPIGHYVLAAAIMITYVGVRMAVKLTKLEL